jgi:hypothetical protein
MLYNKEQETNILKTFQLSLNYQYELLIYFLALAAATDAVDEVGSPSLAVPGLPSNGAGNFSALVCTFQMSLAYSAIVRSELNFADPAMFNRHFFVHSIGFYL